MRTMGRSTPESIFDYIQGVEADQLSYAGNCVMILCFLMRLHGYIYIHCSFMKEQMCVNCF